ncbi:MULTISPECIES: hypothetical protein [Gordonibacter]|nr:MULTISPECIES: hypothetical protein [Gordonibacter]
MPNYDGRVFVSLDYAGGDIVRGHQWRLLGWYLDHRGAGAGQ